MTQNEYSPQPHCDHECVCTMYIGGKDWLNDSAPCNHPCNPSYDTRSRPHQPAAQCKYWRDASNLKSDFIGQIIGEHYCSLDLTDHDNIIAATIRNETLDAIQKYCDTLVNDNFRASLQHHIDSLRTSTSTQEQHR